MSQRIRLRRRSPTLSPLPTLPPFEPMPKPKYPSISPLRRSLSHPRLMRQTLVVPLLLLNAALMLALLVFPRAAVVRPHRDTGMDAWIDLVGSDGGGPETAHMEHYGGTGREGCGYCGPRDTICREYGEHNLARSRAYEGPNTRLFRVLTKHLHGQPLKVGVLGGAPSAGAGVGYRDLWTLRFFDLFNSTFPHPANEFVNGAQRGGSSAYFSSCWPEHIDDDTDLIILELSGSDHARDEQAARDYELLLRGLLELPRRPAVVSVNVLGLEQGSVWGAGDVQLGVAEYYDVPTISLRNVLLQHVEQSEANEDSFFVKTYENTPNLAQMNDIGHRMLADLLLSFIKRQACAMRTAVEDAIEWSEGNEIYPEFGDVKDDVPHMSLFGRYDRSGPAPPLRPTCMSAGSSHRPLNPSYANGWKFTWSDEDGKAQYRATRPGALVMFDLDWVEAGVIRVGYVKGRTQGLGSALCWVDDDKENGTILHASSLLPPPSANPNSGDPAHFALPTFVPSQAMPLLYDVDTPIKTETIAVGVGRGPHRVSCELLGGGSAEMGGVGEGGRGEFRIVSVSGI